MGRSHGPAITCVIGVATAAALVVAGHLISSGRTGHPMEHQ
jgi:hypothetical protein